MSTTPSRPDEYDDLRKGGRVGETPQEESIRRKPWESGMAMRELLSEAETHDCPSPADPPTATPEQEKRETYDIPAKPGEYVSFTNVPRVPWDCAACGERHFTVYCPKAPAPPPSPLSLADVPRYDVTIASDGEPCLRQNDTGKAYLVPDIEALVQRLEKENRELREAKCR